MQSHLASSECSRLFFKRLLAEIKDEDPVAFLGQISASTSATSNLMPIPSLDGKLHALA
jgi:membrane-associated protease RseP (regulator of RpoE activity)